MFFSPERRVAIRFRAEQSCACARELVTLAESVRAESQALSVQSASARQRRQAHSRLYVTRTAREAHRRG